VHNHSDKNVKSKFRIFQIREQSRNDVVHSLAIADFRENKCNCLQNMLNILCLFLSKWLVVQWTPCPLHIHLNLMD
jgi:hypothetical protein